MYPDPINVRLIHDRTIVENLERHGPDHLLRERQRWPRPSAGLHRLAAMPLLRLADRIRLAKRAGESSVVTTAVAPRHTTGGPHPTCR